MGLVENIKLICNQRGMSIPKLGAELGFGNGAIYNWNKMSPSIDKVQKVADYLGVSLERVLYGFDYSEFVSMVNYVKEDRTIEDFAKDTGVDLNEIHRICLGLSLEQPSRETVEKIAASNSVDFIISRDDLLEAAGYISEREGENFRKSVIDKLTSQYEEAGFTVRFENEDYYERVYIDHENHGTVAGLFLQEFMDSGDRILNDLLHKYVHVEKSAPYTIAAHHEGEDWTEDEIKDIEMFKAFLRNRRKQQE